MSGKPGRDLGSICLPSSLAGSGALQGKQIIDLDRFMQFETPDGEKLTLYTNVDD
jgi:hypothetical protein